LKNGLFAAGSVHSGGRDEGAARFFPAGTAIRVFPYVSMDEEEYSLRKKK
jgi:hypothetical protein